MTKSVFLFLTVVSSLLAIEIIDKPIQFGAKRTALTKAYITQHYGLIEPSITITPQVIVIHYTANNDLNTSWGFLDPETLGGARSDIANASALNVSAHFMVDRDGSIYRLMDETTMARHVIGLNYSSIGIENVGGADGVDNLTDAQIRANIALIDYLIQQHPTITTLIGHHEYRCLEQTPLWLEKDAGYRTTKQDPGERFMQPLRGAHPTLLNTPCKTTP